MVKTELLQVRYSLIEREALSALAQSEALNASEMVRILIRTAAKQRGVWPLPVQPAGLPQRTRDIRKPQVPTRARITSEEIK